MKTNETTSMFINYSNHPSSRWNADQLAAARRYGKVVDVPFPVVSPSATTVQVNQMAREVVASMLALGESDKMTVHVMGEMTLTYNIVRRLKRHHVRCVASTTERRVTEVDGKSVSEFSFVQFREY